MALTIQERTNLIKLAVGLYNAAPGATYLNELATVFEANGRNYSVVADILSNSNSYKTINPASQTSQEFAASFLTPFGLQSNTEAVDFIVARLNAGASKGTISVQALVAINDSTNPVFASAKAILNNKAAVAENFSVTLARNETNLTNLKNVISSVTADPATVAIANAANAATGGNEAPVNLVLTANQDIVTGGAGADSFRGVAGAAVGAQDQTTLNSSDILDGAGGLDTLIVNMTGANYSGGARIKSIETLQIGTNLLTPVTFDYNVNAGSNEITDVLTIVADQINVGENLSINNIVRTTGTTVTPGNAGTPASAPGVVPVVVAVPATSATNVPFVTIPAINWINDNNTQAAGVLTAAYRAAELVGTTDTQVLGLSRVTNGTFNVSAGIETINVKGYSTQEVTLVSSTNADAGGGNVVAADLISTGTLTKVVIDHFAGSTAVIGKAAGVQAVTGLTDRVVGADGTGVATQSNLLSVGARVIEVDASAAVANTNVRFVAKTTGAETNVIYKGGLANDYVEFEVGNVSATGGTGDDTFAFINNSVLNSSFTTADSIIGGAGVDTIQLGLNGVGNYDVDFTEFNNKSGIDVLDLRGAINKVTLADGFVTASDAGLTVRTDRIVQTSLTDSANAVGSSFAENDSVNTINLTKLAGNRVINVVGGSGSDRIIGNEQSITSNATLAGGTNVGALGGMAVATDYDTLTVVDNSVLSRGDLSKVSGFEGLVLVKSDNTSNRQFTVELTEAFILANTQAANDATGTSIDDRVFQIGTVAAANANILTAGDTVTIDISDLLSAGVYKASLGTRGIDVTSLGAAGVTVTYLANGVAATAAQITSVTQLDALRGDVLASAGVPVVAPAVVFNIIGTAANDPALSITAAADNVQALAGDDVITTTATALTLTGTIDGGLGNDGLVLNAATTNIVAATITGVENLTVAAGTTTLTAAQFNGFTGGVTSDAGLLSIANLTTAGTFNIGARAANTNGFDVINLAAGGSTVNLTGVAAVGQTVTGGAGNDTFSTNNVNLAFHVLNGGAGIDSLTITDQLTAAFGLVGNSIEVYNLTGLAAAGIVTGSDGAGVVYNVSGASVVAATGNVLLGTGGQTVNSTTTGTVAFTGGTGADTFNLGAGAERIVKSGSTFGTTGTTIDTVNNFKLAGADTFGGVIAATTLNVLTIATSDFVSLAANIQNAATTAGASLAANTQAYIVNVTAGTAIGQYALQNTGGSVTTVDATDFFIKLVGTTGAIVAGDFAL